MKIRRVKNRDIKTLFEIHKKELPLNDQMTEDCFLEEFNQSNRIYFLAQNGQDIVGFIGLYEYDDDLNIINIATTIKRQGIGSLLINTAKQLARQMGKKTLSLEVDQNNKNAIEFYKKQGFFVTNIRKNYYVNSDAWVMFCNI